MQMKSRLLELIEKDPKKIDGLRFHASLNTLYYSACDFRGFRAYCQAQIGLNSGFYSKCR